MIARHFVVHIAKGPLNRIGLRAVTRQPEDFKAWVSGQPAQHLRRLVNAVIVRHHINLLDPWAANPVEPRQQLPKERIRLARAEYIMDAPSAWVERAR